jgi:parvulin-like peptidyl-prolyl isomerase
MAEKIRCAHILVEKQSTVLALLDRINKGEKFEKLAEEYSLDGSRRRGGDLGYFGRGMMVKEFEKAAFALDVGQVSGPVKTEFGYHLIKRLA